jgi:hypothetical protein
MMSRASRGAICERAWNRLNPLMRKLTMTMTMYQTVCQNC